MRTTELYTYKQAKTAADELRSKSVITPQAQITEVLPPGWKWVKLNEICKVLSGYAFKSSDFIDNGIPVIKIANVGYSKFEWNAQQFLPDEFMNAYKNFRITPGDLLIALTRPITNNTTKVCKYPLNSKPALLNQRVASIKETNTASDYLFWYFQTNSFKNYIRSMFSETLQPNLSPKDLELTPTPLPTLKEQHTIVSKIEELLSELDKGKQQLETAQQQLKIYRQAVLKWAFEGKLTNEHVKEGELPEGWSQVQVKDVAETYGGYAFKSGEFQSEGKYQVIRMGNVRPGILRYNESPVFLNKVDENVLSRSLLKINDVIITQTGTRKKRDYGFTTLISKDNLLLNQRIASIRVKENYSSKFLLYFTWTDLFKDQFFANETGNVGQGNVGMKAVTETLIPFCSLEQQNHIVQEIESRLSVCDKVEETITTSLQQAETLRQSILKKAFEGRLV